MSEGMKHVAGALLVSLLAAAPLGAYPAAAPPPPRDPAAERRAEERPAARPSPQPAPDRSRPVIDYLGLGVRSPELPWAGADYLQALRVLQELARRDIMQLPRADSPRSGRLFERLVAPENLEPLGDEVLPFAERAGQLEALLRGAGGLHQLYAGAAEQGLFFDREALALGAFLLRATAAGFAALDGELTGRSPDAPLPAGTQRAATSLEASLPRLLADVPATLADRRAFRPEERARFAAELRDVLPPLLGRLSPEAQRDFGLRLEALADPPRDPALRTALDELIQAIAQLTAAACGFAPP